MRRYLILVSKLFAFTVCILWVFSFLAVSILILPIFVDILTNHYNLVGWGIPFLTVWFAFTVFVVGAFTARFGLKFIGKWRKE